MTRPDSSRSAGASSGGCRWVLSVGVGALAPLEPNVSTKADDPEVAIPKFRQGPRVRPITAPS